MTTTVIFRRFLSLTYSQGWENGLKNLGFQTNLFPRRYL